VDMARLGGPEPHSRRSGVVHIVAPSDADAIERARELALLLGDRETSTRARGGRAARPTWPGSCPTHPAVPTTSSR